LRRLRRVEVVAAGGASVAGGDERALPLCGRLLPKPRPELIAGRTQILFTFAVAGAEDGCLIVVDRALGREVEAALQ